MKVVAVIAEYNPFHLGHKHHLEEIRRAFGEDTAIVILLSGNYVQRGDLAIFDKYKRAEAAVRNAVRQVLAQISGGDVARITPKAEYIPAEEFHKLKFPNLANQMLFEQQ